MKARNSECKVCRQAGEKLFLKGERCNSPKCALVKRSYAPGNQGKNRRFRKISNYGKQLKEKQALKRWYNLKEKKFKKYVKTALSKRSQGEDSQTVLIRVLENRLDSTVYRLGFISSRKAARQMVVHGHFEVNGKKVNVPSYQVRKGDKVSVRESSLDKGEFRQLEIKMKNAKVPSWLKFDIKKREVEVVGEPNVEEVVPPANISVVFEYYSR